MALDHYELTQQFADSNPEAGDFQEGVVDHEQVKKLTGAMQLKLFELSRKKDLTDAEIKFIQVTANMSTRSIQYLVERQGMTVPNTSSAREHLQKLIMAIGQLKGSWEDLPTSAQALESSLETTMLLATMPLQTVSLRDNPELRAPLEDYAEANLGLLNEVADHTGGLKIDRYLEGNFQNMIAHHELSEAK